MFSSASKSVSSGGYSVKQSLRFRSSASAYLNRTPSVAGNQRTWTWSGWVKRGTMGSGISPVLFNAYLGTGTRADLLFNGDALDFFNFDTNNIRLTTTSVYRDPASWYHIVFIFDTTQTVESNRLQFYVNGVRITSFSTAIYPAQNYNGTVNSTNLHQICAEYFSGSLYNFIDGYLAEVNFIDGQALTPSSFGTTNATTGVWQPARYTGSYGTNGFYLTFGNKTSTTTLGYDTSGNGNNWTTNNISLTAGSTYDSMLDSPTNYDDGGNGVGNYAVLNPLSPSVTLANATLSNGNLNITGGPSGDTFRPSTLAMSSGKWYFETTIITVGTISVIGLNNVTLQPFDGYVGVSPLGYGYLMNGNKQNNNVTTAYGASYTSGDIIGCAFDADAGTLTFYKNGVSQGVAYSSIPAASYCFNVYGRVSGGANNCAANFGQRPFQFSPPSGFKALNTQNLPTPAIVKGSAHMNAVLDVGLTSTLTSNGTIATSSSGGQPYEICISSDGKSVYTASYGDPVVSIFTRNTSTGALTSGGTIASGGRAYGVCISADGTSVYSTNPNGVNTVSIFTRNTSTGALTSAGSIASGTAPYTICISSDGKSVYVSNGDSGNISIFTRNTSTGALTSGGTIAVSFSPYGDPHGICISADGTSVYTADNGNSCVSIFTRNTSTGALTSSGTISTGANPQGVCISPDGTSVYATSVTANTVSIFTRNTSTGALTSAGTIATGTGPQRICVSPEGGSVYVTNATSATISIYTRNTNTGALTSAGTIAAGTAPIGICIPADGGSVYAANFTSATISLYQRAVGGIKTTSQALYTYYLEWIKDRANINNHQLADTVRGNTAILQSNTTAVETTYTAPSGNSVGWVWNANAAAVTNTSGTITSQVSANPTAGFSVVTYTGTGANATVGHGLGVAPSFIICKARGSQGTSSDWACYHVALGATNRIWLNLTNAPAANIVYWNNTAPTSSVFSLGTEGTVNSNGNTNVAYCFAAIAGYSAFGSYTGNGSADGPFVWTGFLPRFVLIKLTSGIGGDWIIWDSSRNPYNVIGNYLYADSSAAEGSGSGMNFLSNGIKISNDTGGGINGSGSTYIYACFAENPFKNSLAR